MWVALGAVGALGAFWLAWEDRKRKLAREAERAQQQLQQKQLQQAVSTEQYQRTMADLHRQMAAPKPSAQVVAPEDRPIDVSNTFEPENSGGVQRIAEGFDSV